MSVCATHPGAEDPILIEEDLDQIEIRAKHEVVKAFILGGGNGKA